MARGIVEAWLSETRHCLLGIIFLMTRRTYEKCNDYICEDDRLPSHWWKHAETGFSRLPSCCKEGADTYIMSKMRGMKKTALLA